MKNTVMIFNDENFFVPHILDSFLTHNPNAVSKIYSVPFFPPQAKKIQYLTASLLSSGPRFILKYSLVSLLQTILPGIATRMGFPLLADVCKKHQLNFEHIANVNSDHFINQLKAKPDTVVLSMTSQLYKEKVLNQSLAKFYNFHPGLLPRNKGRFPIFWAFLNNDGVQGITCHEINQKIDDGRTVFQKKIIQRLDDDMGSVLNNLKDIAPSAFEEAIKRISKNDYQTDLIQAKSFYGPTPSFREILRYNLLIAKRKLRAISYRLSAKPLEETTNL